MDTSSQTRGGRSGRPLGAPNYKNDILIEIVERYLPQGLEAWNAVAAQYQVESNELTLRRGEDLRENWNKKLCNRMQKPTGKPGVNTDRIFRCIEIERRIQAEAAAAILGADSAESGHSRDDGDSALSDVAQDDDLGNDGDEEDEEVAAVNAAEAEDDDENEAVVVRPRPQSLPAFVGVGVGASGVESPGSIIVQASVRATSSAGRRGGIAQQVRRHHRGGVRHHCHPATSAAEGGGVGGRPKILLIANGGQSQRPWTGWRNPSKAGGDGTVGVVIC